MTHDDEKEFLNYVKGTGNVEVLPHQSTMSSFVPVVEMPEADQEESNRIFWLFNRSVSSNLVVDYDDDHGVYVIDGLRSSAVEFARCFTRRLHSPGVVLSDFGWSNKITPAVEGGGAPLLRSL